MAPWYPKSPTSQSVYHDYPDVQSRSWHFDLSAVRSTLGGVTPPPSPIPERPRLNHPPMQQNKIRKYSVRRYREVIPGVLEDGTITARHPFVAEYLRALTSRALCSRLQAKRSQGSSVPPARLADVGPLLGLDLDDRQSRVIFALAALAILYHPRQRIHECFWGRRTRAYTDRIICSVRYIPRPLIYDPEMYLGLHSHLYMLNCMALTCHQSSQHATVAEMEPRTLRKRHASARISANGVLKANPAEGHEHELMHVEPYDKRITSGKEERMQTRSRARARTTVSPTPARAPSPNIPSTPAPDTPAAPARASILKWKQDAEDMVVDHPGSVTHESNRLVHPRLAPSASQAPRRSTRQAARRVVSNPATATAVADATAKKPPRARSASADSDSGSSSSSTTVCLSGSEATVVDVVIPSGKSNKMTEEDDAEDVPVTVQPRRQTAKRARGKEQEREPTRTKRKRRSPADECDAEKTAPTPRKRACKAGSKPPILGAAAPKTKLGVQPRL
ncbi:hypothetical protein SCP_0311310 [Sparassis crispa]|uniref:Uncharacterized protein n=1 Tax=Sparassis crispa TaxID=139825 RepID=A0A401GGW2_9APHY|nr:hypothetical protein SCP_0311310 [Sparassis crispa]GBE81402.1 hypothetical protein SCP_0311310 [Sparassis crispa]